MTTSSAGRTSDPQPNDRRIQGAVAAYRGYRRQALYALWRLLAEPTYTLRPEGVEDLSVSDEMRLVDAIQVKSLGTPLVLSDLEPRVERSFFPSAASRAGEGGAEHLTVVSFGPLGPQLEAFAAGNSAARTAVRSTLVDAGIEPAVLDDLLDRLRFHVVDEARLRAEVGNRLRDLLTGIDPEAAFELLTLWLYLQSEARAEITLADVRDRVLAVGRFLADRRDYHSHWYTSIVPINGREISDDERAGLAVEFYQGVSVRYEHIAAGLAVPRRDRLAEIDRAFEAERVVILHAASGQGKTTLAYLFMGQLPETWRFSVPFVENRSHAIEVARALASHAKAMALPLFVHVDVGPRDTDWPTLVRDLATEPLARVLVTIREEDWRRSTGTWSFASTELDLTFSNEEAVQIYDDLRGRFPDAPQTFAEAWSRFGGSGPLLEFVYLVTQRQDLPGRLRDQVETLRQETQDGPDRGAIDFLRYVAVIAETGARAYVRPLGELAGLHEPAHTLARLEQEYLIRQSDEGALVGGLHPVRSRIPLSAKIR